MAKKLKKTLTVTLTGMGDPAKGFKIGVARCDRAQIAFDDLDALITDAQLEITLKYDPNAAKDADGQKLMDSAAPGLGPWTGIGTCSGGRWRGEYYSFGLVFFVDIDTGLLLQYAHKTCKMTLVRLGDRAVESGDEGADVDEGGLL